MHFFWFKKLCDENFHEQKIVPSHLIHIYFERLNFIHAFALIANYLSNFPSFTKKFCFDRVAFFCFPELPPYILSNFLKFNKHNLIEKKSFLFILLTKTLTLSINYLITIIKSRSSIKQEFSNTSNFVCEQIISALPPFWKKKQ